MWWAWTMRVTCCGGSTGTAAGIGMMTRATGMMTGTAAGTGATGAAAGAGMMTRATGMMTGTAAGTGATGAAAGAGMMTRTTAHLRLSNLLAGGPPITCQRTPI
jgi:hypothetical protein